MGHLIETYGNQAAAVFARQDAWHRLVTVVRDRAFTAQEAMTLGHLGGWDVHKGGLAGRQGHRRRRVPRGRARFSSPSAPTPSPVNRRPSASSEPGTPPAERGARRVPQGAGAVSAVDQASAVHSAA